MVGLQGIMELLANNWRSQFWLSDLVIWREDMCEILRR